MYVQPYTTTCDRINLTSSAGSSFLPWDEAAYSYALVKPRLSSKNLGMRPMKAWEWDQWKPGNEADVNLWSMNLTEVIKSLSSPWRHWIQTNKKQTDKKQFYVFSFRNFAGVDFWHELDALLYFKSTKLLVISLFFSILPPLFSILLLPSHRWSLPFVCNLTT